MVEHVHVEAPAAPGQQRADAAEADDAHAPVVNVLAGQRRELSDPAAGTHESVGLHDAARSCKQQAEGHVGSGGAHRAGRVGHPDTARGAGLQVDVVEARADRDDEPQPRARREQLGIDAIAGDHEHAVGMLEQRGQVATLLALGGHTDLAEFAQDRQRGVRETPRQGDEGLVRGGRASVHFKSFLGRAF